MITQIVRYFPAKSGEVARPCPALLTESEAIVYYRLDESGVKHPEDTLRRFRQAGLEAVQVGKKLLYRIEALDEFIQRKADGGFN